MYCILCIVQYNMYCINTQYSCASYRISYRKLFSRLARVKFPKYRRLHRHKIYYLPPGRAKMSLIFSTNFEAESLQNHLFRYEWTKFNKFPSSSNF